MTTSLTSSSRFSSSPSLPPSLPTLADELLTLDPDQLLERITYAKGQIAHFQGILEQYLDALDQMVQDHQIDSDITYNDWHLYRQPGRKTYSYPDSITQQETNLKQAKEMAVAEGKAIVKQGSPFWTIKHVG